MTSFVVLTALLLIVGAFFGAVLTVTLLHESAHAAAALLLTPRPVELFVAAGADTRPALRFRLGRLSVALGYHPLHYFRGGFCRYHILSTALGRQAIILLLGPLLPLAVLLPLCLWGLGSAISGLAKLFLVLAAGWAALSLIINLIPRPTLSPVIGATFTDGWQLRRLWRLRGFAAAWARMVAAFQRGEFTEAGIQAEELMHRLHPLPDAQRMAISAHIAGRNFEQARLLDEHLRATYEPNSQDFAHSGLLQCRLGQYETGLAALAQALQLDPTNYTALNNRGYTLNQLGRYEEAILDFDQALTLDPTFAYAYNNRGLAHIRLGREAQGLADIDTSFQLDADNAYAYRNLGIYHLERGAVAQALPLLERARQLDPHTHLIEEYLAQARQQADDPAAR